MDILKLKPLNGKVLFRVDNIKQTSSGIILAPVKEIKKDEGVVVAIASDVSLVKEGDVILIDKYSAALLKETEECNYFLCSEDDIYGVIQ